MGAKWSRPSGPAEVVEARIAEPSASVVVGTPLPTAPEPTTKQEPPAAKALDAPASRQKLDLVFTMDCTGSMGSYIHAAKTNIEAIVDRLVRAEGYDLRFGLVAYRDHPPQDHSYVTKSFPFTAEAAQMKRHLKTLSANGGGDGPEAVAAGLKATLDSEWRPDATKVAILIADAPPHGLGESGDGFPNGAPDGVDPLEVLEQMSCRGICVYSVGCEPALSHYRHAKAFMIAAAQKTNGQAVSLSSAAALADVIMGGACEEMDLEQLAAEVVAEVQQMRSVRPEGDEDVDSDEERAHAWESIQARGHTTRHMQAKKLRSKRAGVVLKASSLAEARGTLKSASPSRKRASAKGLSAMTLDAKAAPARGRARTALPAAIDCEELEETDNESDVESTSDRDSELGEEAACSASGVRLESRALSFSQMSRIYRKQKKMGVL